jgi:hypothetical protein
MTEQELIEEKTNLTIDFFNSLFNEIQLSEIINYEHDFFNNDVGIKGISFYGRRITLEEYDKLCNILKSRGLKLLISLDTLTKRWNNFSFSKFPNRDLLTDIEKQCYSLIKETDNSLLSKYIYSYDENRKILNKTLQIWTEKYNLDILWNDYFDIVLKFENAENYKTEISQEIDDLLYYKLSNELSVEEKINERFKNYPLISLYLK